MKWFTRFFRSGGTPDIRYGFRGEDLVYRRGREVTCIQFTYLGGPCVDASSIRGWNTGPVFTTDERVQILEDVLAFLERRRPIVSIDAGDPAMAELRTVCERNVHRIAGIEIHDLRIQRENERAAYVAVLTSGKGLTIDGTEITSIEELDRLLQSRRADDRPPPSK